METRGVTHRVTTARRIEDDVPITSLW
jgi:hypothetical protein